MAEHGLGLDDDVIGVAFDGTGFGTDGAVWGGEVLVGGYKSFRRAAHLAYVPLAGGDASVERPYRMALAHLRAADVDWSDDLACVAACPEPERGVLAHQLDTGFGCVPTSSIGRLFDAIASLVGIRHVVDFEAQAAVELEALARSEAGGGAVPLRPGGRPRHPRGPGRSRQRGPRGRRGPTGRRTSRAWWRLASTPGSPTWSPSSRSPSGPGPASTSSCSAAACSRTPCCWRSPSGSSSRPGSRVLRPRLLPPNDGGIALGQIVIGSVG